MFSRFFKPKFYKKSKSCLDTIKLRIEYIQRRRNAVQKFLKNDVAEFLSRGLDYNAYQRAAGLLVEYNISLCYDMIDKYTGCVLNHLDDLTKQRECPDECKEAVQTLIYAAARFGDLPELRELRSLFTQKFEKSFETYLSQEFVWKSRQDLPARETTIRFLHDIAGEFSLQWDSDSLIQQIFRPPSFCGERNKDEEIEMSNKGEEGKKEVVSIHESGDEEEEPRSSTELWSSQDSKKASSSSSSPSESEDDDDDEPENQRPFSSGRVPAPYRLTPKKPTHQVKGDMQNEEKLKPEPEPKPKGTSVRTGLSHVHPKLPDYDELVAQLSSLRTPIKQKS